MDRPQRNSVQLKTIEENDPDETAPQQWHSDLEKALSAAVGDPPRPKYKKGPCPLCYDFFHPNKSVFFCKVFRKKTLDEKRALVKNAGLCALCLAKNTKGHSCPVAKCPRCSGGHNIQLCPQEDQEQTLVGAEGDGGSEEEEEIQAWLDNKDWNGMSTLSCKDDPEDESTNLNTLREVFDQDRILTLMDTSDPPTPNILEEDSEGVPTGPLSPASSAPEEEVPAQPSFSKKRKEGR